jgi:aminopeptidase YwaD
MTGEDPLKTGGPFLIEKMPDPSAVWARPSDPHTEWGGGQYKAELLKGTLLNDLFLGNYPIAAERIKRTSGFV